MAGKPKPGSKADAIRQYVRRHPDGRRQDFIDETGISVTHSSFSTVKGATLKDMKKEAKKNPHQKDWKELAAQTDPRKHRPVILSTATAEEALQHVEKNLIKELADTKEKLDEYRYRVWKLEGEKFGYVERLLKETH